MSIHLSEIYIYPIKGLAGIQVPDARVQMRGLQYDRRWMLVNEAGRFVSQREFAQMALIGTRIAPPYLEVFDRQNPTSVLQVPLEPDLSLCREVPVEVWGTHFNAYALDSDASAWFSSILEQNLRLVYMPENGQRITNPDYAPEGQRVSFADGYPYLLIGQASLDDLNERLENALPINRFRPNFVCTGSRPFEEDKWADFSIGQIQFRGVKPCARCNVTTIDQDTAEQAAEPIKTLATYRLINKKILFGLNVIWMSGTGDSVKVGDVIQLAH